MALFEHSWKLYPSDTLSLPRTPATWIGAEYQKITRITVTCGGGMGGSRWEEYVKRGSIKHVYVGDYPMVRCTRWDDTVVTLNPRYIVDTEDFTLVNATYDSRNRNFPLGPTTIHTLVRDGKSLELVNKY